MKKGKNFGIICGDDRQIAMIDSLVKDGNKVYIYGFDKKEVSKKAIKTDMYSLIENSGYIVLPFPVTKDLVTLNAPFSSELVFLDDDFANALKNKKVFCGLSEKLKEVSSIWGKLEILDYTKREDFAFYNAVPTVEGAIEIAINNTSKTIYGSNCLVSGFGRIGKILSKTLGSMGANVTVSARKLEDLSFIHVLGYKPILTSKIKDYNHHDIIFNTIPFLIFSEDILKRLDKDTLIIDLASLPGGIDFKSAKKLKIRAIHALALPGQVAPYTAGEIMKTTICNMIKEGI